ncbi:hypothetical protein OXX59_002620 [Metschnikowia pulcherrima]
MVKISSFMATDRSGEQASSHASAHGMRPSPSETLPHMKGSGENGSPRDCFSSTTPLQPREKVNHEAAENEHKGRYSSEGSATMLASPTEKISKAFDLPDHKLYSEAIISQMLSLRIEQEKTKQMQVRIELGQVMVRLVKVFEAHGLESQLIHRLLLDENNDEYKSYIEHLRSQMGLNTDITPSNEDPKIQKTPASPKRSSFSTPSPKSHDNSPGTTHNSRATTVASSATNSHNGKSNFGEMRLLPPLTLSKREGHSRGSSDSVLASGFTNREYHMTATPMKSQTSPSLPRITPVYPAFYPMTEQFPHQRRLSRFDQSGEASQRVSPQFAQTVPRVIYSPHCSQPIPGVIGNAQSAHSPPMVNYEQPHQPMIYMNTPHGAPASAMPQYFVPPPICTAPNTMSWPAPQIAQQRKRNSEGETNACRKHKAAKSGISFMISTPNNPPAQKYNKPPGSR